MVDGGAYASKEKHLQGKKEIGGKDPPTREQEKIRYWETRKEYAKTVTKAEIQSWQDFVTEKVHRPVASAEASLTPPSKHQPHRRLFPYVG
jgi:hypothetical protein